MEGEEWADIEELICDTAEAIKDHCRLNDEEEIWIRHRLWKFLASAQKKG